MATPSPSVADEIRGLADALGVVKVQLVAMRRHLVRQPMVAGDRPLIGPHIRRRQIS